MKWNDRIENETLWMVEIKMYVWIETFEMIKFEIKIMCLWNKNSKWYFTVGKKKNWNKIFKMTKTNMYFDHFQ